MHIVYVQKFPNIRWNTHWKWYCDARIFIDCLYKMLEGDYSLYMQQCFVLLLSQWYMNCILRKRKLLKRFTRDFVKTLRDKSNKVLKILYFKKSEKNWFRLIDTLHL